MRCVRGIAPAAGNEGDALMTDAAFGANAPASPKADDKLERRSSAYVDLEPKIRNIGVMARIATFYATEFLGRVAPHETEDEGREKSVALFAIRHVEELARDLEKAYEAGWNSGSPTSRSD